jgi:WD40 repeat protein
MSWEPAGEVRLRELNTGKERIIPLEQKSGVRSLAFSHDESILAIGVERLVSGNRLISEVKLFDPIEGKDIAILAGIGSSHRLVFSPDDRTLVSADRSGQVILWTIDSRSKSREWRLPGPVLGVAFAPDGKHLALGNGNGTIYVLRLDQPPEQGTK